MTPLPSKPTGNKAAGPMIFVIDDEPVIRHLMQRLLQAEGYQVVVAENRAAARVLWQEHQTRIALLVIDWMMPDGPTGRKLAEEFWREKPVLPVIFMSGYDLPASETPSKSDTSFVQKPFDVSRLLNQIKTALEKNTYVANPAG